MDEKYELNQVIAIYAHDVEYGHSDYYIECHDIGFQDKKPILQEGRPLTEDHLKAIAIGFEDAEFENSGFFSPKILSFSNKVSIKRLLWWRPAGLKMLFFTKDSGLESGVIHLPALLFYAKNNALKVFAIKSKRRPTAKTRLFKAPIYNVYNDGQMCMGNVPHPSWQGTADEIRIRWGKAFFDSEFSHTLGSKQIKGSLEGLLKNLLKTKEPFPDNMLVSHKLSLGEFIKRENI